MPVVIELLLQQQDVVAVQQHMILLHTPLLAQFDDILDLVNCESLLIAAVTGMDL